MKEFNSIITLAKIQDGADSAGYVIKSNVEQVFKKILGGGGEIFSPQSLILNLTQNGENIFLEDKEVVIQLAAVDAEMFQVSDEYITISDDGLTINFQLNQYYTALAGAIQPGGGEDDVAALNDEDDNEDDNSQAIIKQQLELLLKNVFFIYCSISHNGELIAEKAIQATYEVDSQLASFAVTADGINAAVGAAKLEFNQNGLTINNGGLLIKDGEDDALKFEDNKLWIRGHIEAVSGVFSGKLEAKEGTIAGLTLEENKLHYINKEKKEILAIGVDVDADEAYLRADKLLIGNSGKIEGQLAVGGAILQNKANFLQAGDISMSNDGTIKLGGSGRIYAENGNWSINGDGSADFKNIRADNVTLQNSVLEIGTVQSVGSLMLFKDSWKVASVLINDGRTEILLDGQDKNKHNISENDYIYWDNNYLKVVEVKETGEIVLNGEADLKLDQVITKLDGQTSRSNYLISILGGSQDEGFDFAQGNSLTMAQYSEDENGDLFFDKKLILGHLKFKDSAGADIDRGVGLYADNVILNGSLVTQLKEGNGLSYAGINTTSGAKATIFAEKEAFNNDDSNIVFWAGSDSDSETSIQRSKFQVSRNGSVYAQNIYLEDAVMAGGEITGSIIKGNDIIGSRIYGAELHGSVNGSDSALRIYNTKKGISFREASIDKKDEEVETLSINAEGLSMHGQAFIDFVDNAIEFSTLGKNNIVLSNAGLGSYSFGAEGKRADSLINLTDTIEIKIGQTDAMVFDSNSCTSKMPFSLEGSLKLGTKMEYKKVLTEEKELGYDLYIS